MRRFLGMAKGPFFLRRSGPFVAGLFFTTGLAWSVRAETEEDDGNFREDVIMCEEALAHATTCCRSIHVQQDACRYYRYEQKTDCGGCMSGTYGSQGSYRRTWPVLGLSESEAILESSCDELRCEELAEMFARKNDSAGSSTCSYR